MGIGVLGHVSKDVTKFAFEFDDVRTLTIFSSFELVKCFRATFSESGFTEIVSVVQNDQFLNKKYSKHIFQTEY